MHKTIGRNLTTQLNIQGAVIVISALSLIGVLVFTTTARTARESIAERNALIAQRTGSEISLFLSDAVDQLQIAADMLPLLHNDRVLRNTYLGQVALTHERFRSLRLVDGDGNLQTLAGRAAATRGRDKADAGGAAQGTELSEVKYTDYGLPYTTIHVPVVSLGDTGDKPWALLADLDLRNVWQIIDQVRVGDTGIAVLLTSGGTVIAHPNRTWLFAEPPYDVEAIARDLLDPFRPVTHTAEDRNGNRKLIAANRLPNGWILLFEQDLREAYDPVTRTLFDSVALVVTVIAVTVRIGVFASSRSLKPLESLTRAMTELDLRDLNYRIPVDRDDEIGRLSAAFNTMIERLNNRTTALQESESKYRVITENASDLIFALDREGRILFLNKVFEKTSGLDRDQYEGRHFSELLDENGTKKLETHLAGLFAPGGDRAAEFDVSLVPRKGEPIELEIRLVRGGKDRRVQAVFGVARDVTERRVLQQRMLQSEKLSTMGEIVAGVAHELNNPLTTITGYAELMQSYADGEGFQSKAISGIHREAERAARIVKNLLSFARRHPLERSMIQVNDTLRDILEFRAYEMNVNQIRVVSKLDPSLPMVFADPHQLKQVFINVINNAIHALKSVPGNRILVLETATESGSIVVSFRDTGAGVENAIKPRVFDPFFTTKKPGDGTGLGLSISLGIIQEHEGSIDVGDAPEGGASFTIRLPVGTGPEGAYQSGGGDAEMASIGDRRVLLVDDEQPILDMLQAAFEQRGCTVSTAKNGEEALQQVKAEQFDNVVCDLRMPVADGWTFYQWAKDVVPGIKDKLVFMTGDIVNDDLRTLIERQGIRMVNKPFEFKDILSAIAACKTNAE